MNETAGAEAPVRPIRPIHDPMPPVTVLYDDRCDFCRWMASELRRWDRQRLLRLTPFHGARRDPILAELLRGHDLGDHVHALDAAGRAAVGSEAVLAIVAMLPGGADVVRLFEVSRPAAIALDLVYRVLNRRRGLVSDMFGLNGPTLREPDGFDPDTTEIAPLLSELPQAV